MRTRSRTRLVVAALVALPLFALAGAAHALPAGIYITPTPIDSGAAGFEKVLQKSKKTFLVQENGKWHFYFVAYLNKPAPADQLNLVFYDAKAKGKQEPNAFPINTKQGAKIVASEASVSLEDGIKPGPFNVKITVLVGGKEVVYAQTKVDLRPPAPAAPVSPVAPAK